MLPEFRRFHGRPIRQRLNRKARTPAPCSPVEAIEPRPDRATSCLRMGMEAQERGQYSLAALLFKAGTGAPCPRCCICLAWLYAQGLGVPKDERRAFRFLLKAAKMGSKEGMELVSRAYELGMGVAKNPVRASEWMIRALGGSGLN